MPLGEHPIEGAGSSGSSPEPPIKQPPTGGGGSGGTGGTGGGGGSGGGGSTIVIGGTVVTNEISGNLGQSYMDLNTYLLLEESYRENSTLNGFAAHNIRYRAHREGYKFNLMLQKVATLCSTLYQTLRTNNNSLTTEELTNMYPTSTEIQKVYHVQAQIRFKEWLLMRDDDRRWFL